MDDVQPHQIPPGQQLLREGRWPTVGEKPPELQDTPWTLSLTGLFRDPRTLTLDDLAACPHMERAIDIHCVTRWSRLQVPFRGVPLDHFLAADQIDPAASFVSFVAKSDRGHSSSVPLQIARQSLLALSAEGAPLTREHGGPLRVIVPDKYFYKSVKWLERIELLSEDCLGYWERDAGYHNGANPWAEERYVAPKLTKQEAARLIKTRDFSDMDLMGLDASGRDLSGLTARGALLRNANFRNSNLQDADFRGANLANAHFQNADLRRCNFFGADLEGANLVGANLCGADLSDASLFGADFFIPSSGTSTGDGALFDGTTVLYAEQISLLADVQEQYLRDKVTRP